MCCKPYEYVVGWCFSWFLLCRRNRALGNALPNFKAFSQGCTAAARIFALISRVPPIDCDDVTGKTLEKVVGNLELRNVDFSYPSRKDVPVFQNFSLQIPAGDFRNQLQMVTSICQND